MLTLQKLDTWSDASSCALGLSILLCWTLTFSLHVQCMSTTESSLPAELRAVLTLSELAEMLGVPAQTLYDLRSQGRGPRGFRVGRELRFRMSEIEAWIARLEAADGSEAKELER